MIDVALFAALVALIALQIGLMLLDRRHRERTVERIESIRIAGPEVRVADLSAVDFDVPQPVTQVPHEHIWAAQPAHQDATSRTYRCQLPRCPRIHTVMR